MALNKAEIYQYLKGRDGLICGICKGSLEEEWKMYVEWVTSIPMKKKKRARCNISIDHKVPRSVLKKKGTLLEHGWVWKDLTNLQLAHRTCNVKKGDEYEEEYAES